MNCRICQSRIPKKWEVEGSVLEALDPELKSTGRISLFPGMCVNCFFEMGEKDPRIKRMLVTARFATDTEPL